MVWPQTEPFVERFSREALVLWPRASRLGVLPPEFAISRLRAALDEVEAGRAPSEASLAGSKDVSSLLKVCTARLDPSLELLELAARPGVSACDCSRVVETAAKCLAVSPCGLGALHVSRHLADAIRFHGWPALKASIRACFCEAMAESGLEALHASGWDLLFMLRDEVEEEGSDSHCVNLAVELEPRLRLPAASVQSRGGGENALARTLRASVRTLAPIEVAAAEGGLQHRRGIATRAILHNEQRFPAASLPFLRALVSLRTDLPPDSEAWNSLADSSVRQLCARLAEGAAEGADAPILSVASPRFVETAGLLLVMGLAERCLPSLQSSRPCSAPLLRAITVLLADEAHAAAVACSGEWLALLLGAIRHPVTEAPATVHRSSIGRLLLGAGAKASRGPLIGRDSTSDAIR